MVRDEFRVGGPTRPHEKTFYSDFNGSCCNLDIVCCPKGSLARVLIPNIMIPRNGGTFRRWGLVGNDYAAGSTTSEGINASLTE